MAPNDLRISVWATTLGGDLMALCRYLDAQEGVALTIFTRDPDRLRRSAVWRLHPLRARLYPRDTLLYPRALRHYADVTIVDNAVPFLKTSRKLFVLWHGFGWKGPDDRRTFSFMKRSIRPWWGDPEQPDERFLWNCFGAWDRAFRARVSGFHPDNLLVFGSAFHDIARDPVDRDRIAGLFPFDIRRRKTVLFAPTWHYGGFFGHWGPEAEQYDRLFALLERREVNVIMRLHDRWRYDRRYRAEIDALQRRWSNVAVQFKDEHQDNTVELQLADVLVTNFSSIADLFYATGRPTVHVFPVEDVEKPFAGRRVVAGTVVRAMVENVRAIWKLSPEENGGLVARSPEMLAEMLARALDEPDCCRARAGLFLERYLRIPDGRNRARMLDHLRAWARPSG